ncbi:MAG TPA: DsrE family protein [Bacteroidia bacterium]|nr:DsrE family protein [Bacteroidia bacterium]
MKKILILFLLLGNSLFAQKAPYKVVFDVTSSDTVLHKMVVRWVNEILSVEPNAEIEMVFYAKSLDMITKDKSIVADNVIKLSAKKNVTFRVCEVAMKNNSVEKSQLLEGVGMVPDGIYEIISKQHEGWGYIKAAR